MALRRKARGLYWGAIDTHGFGILNRARSSLPAVESVLMDDATLHRFRALWTEEKTQHGASELAGLTSAEAAVYATLKQNLLAQNLRLEQERVAWDHACAVLRQII